MAPPYSSTGYNAFTLNPNSINSIHIVDGAITAADIGDLGITGADIANETIGLTKLDASLNALINAIGVIVPDSINSSHIIDGSILTADISNNAITNAKIADFSITNSKLDDNSIDSRKIIAGSIFGTDIANTQIGVNHLTGLAYLDLVTSQADNSITTNKIVDLNVTGAKIANGTISQAKFDASFVAVIQEIANRIMALENTAVIRTTDIVSPIANPEPVSCTTMLVVAELTVAERVLVFHTEMLASTPLPLVVIPRVTPNFL